MPSLLHHETTPQDRDDNSKKSHPAGRRRLNAVEWRDEEGAVMLDYVIRNARVPGAPMAAPSISDFRRKNRRDRAEACGRLALLRRAGLPVLRRAGRDAYPPRQVAHHRPLHAGAEPRNPNHMQRVQAVKPGFTSRTSTIAPSSRWRTASSRALRASAPTPRSTCRSAPSASRR